MRGNASLLAVPATLPRRQRRSGADARTLVDGLIRLGDVFVVALSGLLASRFRFDGLDHPDVVTAALLIGILLAGNIFELQKVYDFERVTRLSHQLPRLIGGWTATIAAVLVVLYGMRSSGDLSRLWVLYWFLAGTVGFGFWRLLIKHVIEKAQACGRLRHRLIIIGHKDLMIDCLNRLERSEQGLQVTAALLLDDQDAPLPINCLRLHNITELESTISEVNPDQIIITLPLDRANEIQSLLQRLKHLPLEVNLYPNTVDAGLPLFGLTRLGDAPLVQLLQRPLNGWRYVLKGVEDRVLAALLLIAISPMFIGIAVIVQFTSPGSVFYRQLRRGFNREPILVFKFRTMYAELCDAPDATHVQQATRNDPRVTPVGRLLRCTSLDELPQLLNVLRGEMSLVGPRPHAVAHDEHYRHLIDDYLGRHRVKPGITGWAQVNGLRGETKTLDEMRRRIELDLEYIKNWSIWLDMRILVRTLRVSIDRDAY